MARGPVAVSGITGFVGAQVVKDLLGEGYTVHGTARNISNPERLAHITGLPGAAERFRAFSADLLTPGAFDEALVGCTGAIHCASPYAMREFPAVESRLPSLWRCGGCAPGKKRI